MSEVLPSYLNGADRAVLGQMPALMVPTFGDLPECKVGQRRFLLAADGIHVEARTPSLHFRAPISSASLPFGEVEPFCELAGGLLPAALGQALVDAALAAMPNETASVVIYRPSLARYGLIEPEIDSASRGHVTFDHWADFTDHNLMVDVHTHGALEAYFSPTDDASDRSIHEPHLSLVFGRCREGEITVTGRLCVGNYLIPLSDLGLSAGDLFESLAADESRRD